VKRKTLAAETSVVDQELGQFEAVVSAWDSDREQDTIAPTAFDRTIAAWRASGKMLPLLFEHSTEAVGHIDPDTMRPTRDGLLASGEVDRSTEHGRQVWRQVKSGSAGFSIGFKGHSTSQKGGGVRWTYIDLLEISATSTPMHPAARALSWKSTQAAVPSDAELRKRAAALGITPPMTDRELKHHTDNLRLEVALGEHPRHLTRRANAAAAADADVAAQNALESRALRKRCDDLRLELALGEDAHSFAQPTTPRHSPSPRGLSSDIRTRARDQMLALLLDEHPQRGSGG
jgi:HK97 family phage prohead protease